VRVEWRTVHYGIAGSAVPAGVSAAVTKAGDVSDEDLIRVKGVAVRAAGRWLGYPLPFGRSDQLTLHLQQPICAAAFHDSGRRLRSKR
jgi:hypothetical protein